MEGRRKRTEKDKQRKMEEDLLRDLEMKWVWFSVFILVSTYKRFAVFTYSRHFMSFIIFY